jgi:hypothetical protein
MVCYLDLFVVATLVAVFAVSLECSRGCVSDVITGRIWKEKYDPGADGKHGKKK